MKILKKHIIFFLSFVIIVLKTNSQNIAVKSFEHDPGNLSAIDNPIPDKVNGTGKCAIISIITTQKGFSFRSPSGMI